MGWMAYSESCSEEPSYDIWDGFGDESAWLGQLLGPINDRFGIAGIWVHQQCAVWSPESNKDFNLKVPAGRTVALVGGNGSGKSMVIALLQRFYDPQGGDICVDGVRIDKLQLKWLRSQMGLVSQEPALFATTIKENILFGKENATNEEVIEASKASNAHNFISRLCELYRLGETNKARTEQAHRKVRITRPDLVQRTRVP